MEREQIIQVVKILQTGLVENTLSADELLLVAGLIYWYKQRTHKRILEAAVKWWDDEAKYLTKSVGDGEWDNVFDDDPEWVSDTRQILDNN